MTQETMNHLPIQSLTHSGEETFLGFALRRIGIEFDKKLISHTSGRIPVLRSLLLAPRRAAAARYYLIGMKLQVPLPVSPLLAAEGDDGMGER